jgi:hypothetical protein
VVSHQFWSCFACELLIPKQFSPVFTKFWIWNYDFTPVFALFWLQFTDPPRVNWKIVLFYFGNIYDLCWIDRNEYIYIYCLNTYAYLEIFVWCIIPHVVQYIFVLYVYMQYINIFDIFQNIWI